MEAFPAIDMEQFEYIKKVIDECDYYLLIIGARYGSTDSDGVSFTEREFDYAVSQGKTVIALLHSDIQSLPKKNFDDNPALEAKLNSFRDKVQTGRMVRFWSNRDQLVSAMMQAITKAINTYPASGWIRGDAAASDDILQECLQLRSAFDELSAQYNALVASTSTELEGLASLEEPFEIRYTYHSGDSRRKASIQMTWDLILRIVGPNLYSPASPSTINANLKSFIHNQNNASYVTVNEMDADTIKIHFHALGLLKIEAAAAKGGGVLEFISLTDKGKAELIKAVAVRSSKS
jgi:hypothetical protein